MIYNISLSLHIRFVDNITKVYTFGSELLYNAYFQDITINIKIFYLSVMFINKLFLLQLYNIENYFFTK